MGKKKEKKKSELFVEAASAMTSKQLTEGSPLTGLYERKMSRGSHVVRHKVRVNHLPVRSQGLRRDGILAALEEDAAKGA